MESAGDILPASASATAFSGCCVCSVGNGCGAAGISLGGAKGLLGIDIGGGPGGRGVSNGKGGSDGSAGKGACGGNVGGGVDFASVCGGDSTSGSVFSATTGFLMGFLAKDGGSTSGTGGSALEGGRVVGGGGGGSIFEKRDLPLPGVLGVSAASILPVEVGTSVRSRFLVVYAREDENQAMDRGLRAAMHRGAAGETRERGRGRTKATESKGRTRWAVVVSREGAVTDPRSYSWSRV